MDGAAPRRERWRRGGCARAPRGQGLPQAQERGARPDPGHCLSSPAHVAHGPPTAFAQEGKSARKVATEAGNEAAVTLFRQWSLFEGDSDEDEDPADAADDDEADT